MPTTDVILREKIEKLGAEADVVTVKRGYARNFLIPTGKAFEATQGNLRHIEHLKEVRAKREADELGEAESIAAKLGKLRLTLRLSIGHGGKAFGSITNNDIAEAVKAKSKVELDRHQFELEKPIKTLGEYEIPVKLHHGVDCVLKLKVRAEEEEEESTGSKEE